ncbi:hypothetical protein BLNAU_10017 [Blattamonas nauphoetae]|uniref:Uncharacterized protein n=1 Tax=Blattamonas nauphoetae TaxID=2049346 RepID=A0ABQ9XUD0_9EUKA|nr:hypothetical protein BLNAU_10017 [Blattamonas nauphoetae]
MFIFNLIFGVYCACDPKILKNYDLRGITAEGWYYNGTEDIFGYMANFRKEIPQTAACYEEGCTFFRTVASTCECYGLLSDENCDELPNNEGVYVEHQRKEFATPHTARWNIRCGKKADIVVTGMDTMTIQIDWRGPQGCAKGGGLGWGWLFIIILFSSLALFFAIGIPINACGRKKSGIEVVPFVYFWVGIPRMVMEGVKCLFSPCRKKQRGFDPLE